MSVKICATTAGTAKSLQVDLTRFICPWCQGYGAWGTDGEPCAHCGSSGVTDDPTPGVDLYTDYGDREPPTVDPVPIPRPPAVMKSPCVDCAYRPGSPEEDSDIRPSADAPFFCHHGMARIGDGYAAAAWIGGMPLGYMLCASWWALAAGGTLPDKPFRDPGGANRNESA